MTKSVLLFGLAMGSLLVAFAQQSVSQLRECTSHRDCQPGFCCILGQERYSLPTCREQPQLGEQCIPDAPGLTNTSLTYPDGSTILLEDVYFTLCPCNIGLYCDRKDGLCQIKQDEN